MSDKFFQFVFIGGIWISKNLTRIRKPIFSLKEQKHYFRYIVVGIFFPWSNMLNDILSSSSQACVSKLLYHLPPQGIVKNS